MRCGDAVGGTGRSGYARGSCAILSGVAANPVSMRVFWDGGAELTPAMEFPSPTDVNAVPD